MSHGSSSSDKCEPNFTPLLDLVLQLVMFFMLCANFVMDQTNVEIKLPAAVAAKAIEAAEQYVYYLNVNEQGKVVFPAGARPKDSAGKEIETSDNPEQLRIILKRRAEEDRDAAKRDAAKAGREWKESEPLRTLIILRVHKECPFDKTYGLMKACRAAGYLRVQLRAILDSGAG